MKKFAIVSLVGALAASPGLFVVADTPEAGSQKPRSTSEHKWLQEGVGEWEWVCTMRAEPGKTAVETKGIERVRAIGEFWVVWESQATVFGMPYTNVMTLGYDLVKKKFVGTWFDSVFSHFLHYEGTLDATNKVLTLEAEGPLPADPTKRTKYKEVAEFRSEDHRVFTNSILGEDGKWTTMLTVESRRRKP